MSSFSSIPFPVSCTYTLTFRSFLSTLHPNVIEPLRVNLSALPRKLDLNKTHTIYIDRQREIFIQSQMKLQRGLD